jgi:hypothetical protein
MSLHTHAIPMCQIRVEGCCVDRLNPPSNNGLTLDIAARLFRARSGSQANKTGVPRLCRGGSSSSTFTAVFYERARRGSCGRHHRRSARKPPSTQHLTRDTQSGGASRSGQVDRDVFAGPHLSIRPGLRQRPGQAALSGSHHNAPGFAGGLLLVILSAPRKVILCDI